MDILGPFARIAAALRHGYLGYYIISQRSCTAVPEIPGGFRRAARWLQGWSSSGRIPEKFSFAAAERGSKCGCFFELFKTHKI